MWTSIKGFFVEEVEDLTSSPVKVTTPVPVTEAPVQVTQVPENAAVQATPLQSNDELVEMIRRKTTTPVIDAVENAFASLESFIPDVAKRWQAALVTAKVTSDALVTEFNKAVDAVQEQEATYVAIIEKQRDSAVSDKIVIVQQLQSKEIELQTALEAAAARVEELQKSLNAMKTDISSAVEDADAAANPFNEDISVFKASASVIRDSYSTNLEHFKTMKTDSPVTSI